MKRPLTALVLSLLGGVTALASSQELSPGVLEYVAVIGPEIALTNVRIVDGTGAPAVEDQTILIRDGRIVAIDDAGSVPMSMDTEVVDLAGHTVIPGLVGVHDHGYYTTSVRAVQMSYTGPRLYLAAGVDPTSYGLALPGYGDQRNFELLLETDFSPEEVIQIISVNGAKVLAARG